MYMKKIIYMAFAAMGLMTLASCSDSDYDEKYSDPSSDRRVWSLSVKDGRHSWPEEKITGIKTNTLILDFLAS